MGGSNYPHTLAGLFWRGEGREGRGGEGRREGGEREGGRGEGEGREREDPRGEGGREWEGWGGGREDGWVSGMGGRGKEKRERRQ